MRPSDLRHRSIARSTAQSECVELSTGTKISRYTGTSPFWAGRVCERLDRLSSKLGNDPTSRSIIHGDRIHRAGVAGAQQPLALHDLRRDEHRDGVRVQFETFGGVLRAVPEPDALVAVDHDPQPVHRPLAETHIPSSPSSLRAVSITAGVISAMPRSLARSLRP